MTCEWIDPVTYRYRRTIWRRMLRGMGFAAIVIASVGLSAAYHLAFADVPLCVDGWSTIKNAQCSSLEWCGPADICVTYGGTCDGVAVKGRSTVARTEVGYCTEVYPQTTSCLHCYGYLKCAEYQRFKTKLGANCSNPCASLTITLLEQRCVP